MTKMVEVTQEDANNYCRVLTALGMEEEGDPADEIERLQSEVYRLRAAIRVRGPGVSDAMRGEIAYQLTKRLVIDMPTARAGVDAGGAWVDDGRGMTDTPLLTVADVARLVVMTEPYVRDKLSRQRGFPEPYRIGNSLRWKREDIERWIESRKLSPAARLSRPHVQLVCTAHDVFFGTLCE